MNAQTLIERALRLVTPRPAREEMAALRTSLGVLIPSAIAEITALALTDKRIAEILTKTYTVTATDGEADISDLLDDGLAPDALDDAEIYHDSSDYQMEWMPDVTALKLLATEGVLGAAREGNTLFFSDEDGETGTLSGEVTIKAVGVPQVSSGVIDIPVRLEGLLAELLAKLVTREAVTT